MKRLLTAVLLASTVWACSPPAQSVRVVPAPIAPSYPAWAANAYLTGCLQTFSQTYCACMLRKAAQRYSLSQFVEFAQTYSETNTLPTQYIALAADCYRDLFGPAA
jgi:hypothetical protein